MTSWISKSASSHQTQLIATAVASGAAVAGIILGFQALRRQERLEDLKHSIPDLSDEEDVGALAEYGGALSTSQQLSKEDERSVALAERARQGDYDNDLILEQLARNRAFLGEAGLEKLRNAFIIVVGCGGVGSHAAVALARSGVSRIRLIDFDQVTLSSLNRHAVATLADVGTPKVRCLRTRLEQITPWVHFDCLNELYSHQAADRLLENWSGGQKPSYVIDAIDNIDSKVDLLSYCHQHSIPVISSMGAGCKSDPTRVFVGDISASIEDPLSRATRRRLRARGVKEGVRVIFSTEKPAPRKAQLLPLPEDEFEKGAVGELGVLPDFRVRILPVLGTMPAVFGYTAANHVMLEVTGYPHDYVPSKGRDKAYESILANLHASMERLVQASGGDTVGLRIPVSKDDVGYIVDEVYRGRSVVSGLATKLTLVPWHPLVPASRGTEPHFASATPDTHRRESEYFDASEERRNSSMLRRDTSRPRLDVARVDHSVPGQKVVHLDRGDLVAMTREEAAIHDRDILRGKRMPEDVYSSAIVDLVRRRQKEAKEFERYR